MSSLKFYYNLKHASFVYPDESYISGSTVAFAALLDRMLALKKVHREFNAEIFMSSMLSAVLLLAPTHPHVCVRCFPKGYGLMLMVVCCFLTVFLDDPYLYR